MAIDIGQLIEEIGDGYYEAKRIESDCHNSFISSCIDIPIWNLAEVVEDGSPSELGRTAISLEWFREGNVEDNKVTTITIYAGAWDIFLLRRIER